MRELISLWQRTLSDPPNDQQCEIWAASHTEDIIRRAILKAATKNQTMGGTMSFDHRVRFASKVMITVTTQNPEHTVNREKLNAEFAAKAQEIADLLVDDEQQMPEVAELNFVEEEQATVEAGVDDPEPESEQDESGDELADESGLTEDEGDEQ